jgi:MEMO1 family protein
MRPAIAPRSNDHKNLLVLPPQVAGRFYPNEAKACAKAVHSYIAQGIGSVQSCPKLIVAPHAGYTFCGSVAGSVYRAILPWQHQIKHVILIGPSHHHAFDGIAITEANALSSCLGQVSINREVRTKLLKGGIVQVLEQPFLGEHALETQLPYLQCLFPELTITPLITGRANANAVADVLESIWGGPETLICISSDLSHFKPAERAKELDLSSLKLLECLDPRIAHPERACGHVALSGAVLLGQRHDLRVTTLDYKHSGETFGQPERVVGYAGITFEYAVQASLSQKEKKFLLHAARQSLEASCKSGKPPEFVVNGRLPPALTAHRACFVSLKILGQLRGCIGSLVPHRPLIEDVILNAYKAGFQDPRFSGLTHEELAACKIEISILSHPRQMQFSDEMDAIKSLRPDVDGVILRDGNNSGLFLPSVWEGLPRATDFLRHLKRKASLPMDHWSQSLTLHRFTAEKISD